MRRKGLQALEQRRDCREDSPDQKRSGPSDTEKQRDSKIANEVVELPTKVRAGCPFFRPEGSDDKQGHDGHAAGFCASTKRKFHIGAHGDTWIERHCGIAARTRCAPGGSRDRKSVATGKSA